MSCSAYAHASSRDEPVSLLWLMSPGAPCPRPATVLQERFSLEGQWEACGCAHCTACVQVPFNEAPDMKAREITEAGKEALHSGRFQMVRVNYANPGARPWASPSVSCGRAPVPVAIAPGPLRSGPAYVAKLRG